jgi:hypothetical protein
MTALDVARQVLQQKQPGLFREIEGGGYELISLPQIKANGPALIACKGWSLLDLFTAQAIGQVYLVLTEAKRQRFESLGLMAMARVAIQLRVKAETKARAQVPAQKENEGRTA